MPWTWTASTWRTASKEGKFWRSSSFNAIETAVGRYVPSGDGKRRLTQLKAILDAISAWRVGKQEKKGGAAFVSPKTARTSGDAIAAREDQLAADNVIGSGETLSVRSAVTDGLVRDVVNEIDGVLDLERSEWGGDTFVDPGWHENGADFRYLVSAQSESRDIVEHRERTIKNPSLIADALISATVITQDSVHLWGPSGFILEAPHKCIGVAFAGDIATRNAVAEAHELEKYREMLRLYLGEGGAGGFGLPAPTALRRATGHNEVAVLGRSYGHTTSVVGVYVIVDEIAGTTAAIKPVTVGQVVANAIKKGTTIVEPVVKLLPGVTERRMEQLLRLERDRGLAIVQIPVGPAVEINGKYWANLYEGDSFRCPLPATAIEHDSNEHRALIAKKDQYNITYFLGHDKCLICNPKV